jgi:hypothetical protein
MPRITRRNFLTGCSAAIAAMAGARITRLAFAEPNGSTGRAPASVADRSLIVLSLRGGDFELTVGEDFSIGYLSHSATTVDLYVQESFTFRMLTTEAAVALSTE